MTDRRSSVAVIDLGAGPVCDHPALRLIGRQTLLEWTVQRLVESSLLDTIRVTGGPHFSAAVEELNLRQAKWVASLAATPLLRCIEVAKASSSELGCACSEQLPICRSYSRRPINRGRLGYANV